MTYDYDANILDALLRHGLRPLPGTSPERLRDAVRDLYRFEIRTLRDRLLAGGVQRRDYVPAVIELRKKYWVLSVPLDLWNRH